MPGPANLRESHAIACPVWECNKAMENDPFVDDLPIKRGHFDTGTENLEKNKTPENAATCFRVHGKSDFYSLQIMLWGNSSGSSTRFQYCARLQVWRPLLSSSQSSLSSVYEKSTDVSRFQQQTAPPGYKAAAKHGLEKTLTPSDSAGNHLRLKCCGKTPLRLYTPCHPQEQHEQ